MTSATDFNAEQATYWFEQACAYAQLVGRIQAQAEATTANPRYPLVQPVSSERAIQAIRQSLADFDQASRDSGDAR